MASLAKIARPRLPPVAPRVRLFARLDAAAELPAVWIAGPPGAGKTTLAASYVEARRMRCLWYRMDPGDADVATFFYYLAHAGQRAAPRSSGALPLFTAEYRGGLDTFARRFFRELWGLIEPPFAFVLDGLHEVPPKCELADALRAALLELPEGARALLLSREEPLPALARFRANGQMDVVESDELRLDTDEARALAALHGAAEEEGWVARIRDRTNGWAAGIVLMLAGRRRPERAPAGHTPAAVFDYFAGEVFDRAHPSARQVMLETALLPTIPAASAEPLTGIEGAAAFLADFARRGYFTLRTDDPEATYGYHPLFREFLLARAAAALPAERLRALRVRAAGLLERRGIIEDAVDLLAAADQPAELANLVLAHSPDLFQAGRGRTLAQWIERIPAPVRGARPWLLFWLGVCTMEIEATAARQHLESAYDAFVQTGDAAGQYRAWTALVEAYLLEWDEFAPLDRWIAEFEALQRRHPKPSERAIEAQAWIAFVEALFWRQPTHPAFAAWLDRVRALALTEGDPAVRVKAAKVLILHDLWWGEHRRIEPVIAALRSDLRRPGIDPLTGVFGHALLALHAWLTARPAESLACAEEALALSQGTGAQVWDFMIHSVAGMASLELDDVAAAVRHIAVMRDEVVPGRRMNICNLRLCEGALALRRSDGRSAREHGEAATALADQTGMALARGFNRIIAGLGWVLEGRLAEGRARLGEAQWLARQTNNVFLEFCSLVPLAIWALREGDPSAPDLIRRALGMARDRGFATVPWIPPQFLAELCAAALERGIEPDTARSLVARRRLAAPAAAEVVEGWPWPVCVRTLGAFEVAREGEPIRFGRKSQRKPLELLKALVALGGREVSEERLAAELWPDADGDAGLHALETTLYRLRRLLGSDVISSRDRKLTLVPGRCFVDMLAVERLVERASGRLERGARDEALRLTERALALYRGAFLPGDDGLSCFPAARGRLRRRVERHLSALRSRLGSNARAESLVREAAAADVALGLGASGA